MKIISKETLAAFRGAGCCEWCGLWFDFRQACHIEAKGAGGGKRLDIRINLVALCFRCHSSSHAGLEPSRIDLEAVVAAREGLLQPEIRRTVQALLRLPKDAEIPEELRRFLPMKILKAGKLPGEKLVGTCSYCKCRVEASPKEAGYQDGKPYVTCPTKGCVKTIWLKEKK